MSMNQLNLTITNDFIEFDNKGPFLFFREFEENNFDMKGVDKYHETYKTILRRLKIKIYNE